jgi:hypothetical protein
MPLGARVDAPSQQTNNKRKCQGYWKLNCFKPLCKHFFLPASETRLSKKQHLKMFWIQWMQMLRLPLSGLYIGKMEWNNIQHCCLYGDSDFVQCNIFLKKRRYKSFETLWGAERRQLIQARPSAAAVPINSSANDNWATTNERSLTHFPFLVRRVILCWFGRRTTIRSKGNTNRGQFKRDFLSGRKWSHTTAAAVAAATAELITSFSIFYYLGRF